jgi:predicted GNAT family acetyltransferase
VLRLELAVHLYPALEEAVDQAQHIGCVHVLAHAGHQAVVVDAVEERLQVDVHHPAVPLSDRGLGMAQRLVGAALGPKAVAVGVKVGLPLALYDLGQRLLDEPVDHRGDAQESGASVGFGDLHSSHGLGAVTALDQLCADGGPVRFQVFAQLLDGHAVNAGRALVAPDLDQGLVQVLAVQYLGHQGRDVR